MAQDPLFDVDQANLALTELFAAWVRDLGLEVIESRQGQVRLQMPGDARVCREGGTVSGQALAAMADTAMALAIWSARGGRVPITTVDLHVTFLRPVPPGPVIADAQVVRAGRTMAFVNVAIRSAASESVAATAIGTFAVLAA